MTPEQNDAIVAWIGLILEPALVLGMAWLVLQVAWEALRGKG